jgi:hypothetical protein
MGISVGVSVGERVGTVVEVEKTVAIGVGAPLVQEHRTKTNTGRYVKQMFNLRCVFMV